MKDSDLTPWEYYQKDLQRDDFQYDAAQEQAVKHLQRLYDDYLHLQQQRNGFAFKLKQLWQKKREPLQGLYFWGGVGRGKTYLMDVFFHCLPTQRKRRMHFHRFMHYVHDELKTLQQQENPLNIVAQRIAADTDIICFDEFFVSDITDAMILGGLFEKLFAEGVSLVATSNIIPDGLYRNGLQRERFLPAIKLLNQYTDVVNVDSGTDYRMRALDQAEIYHFPLDAQAEQNLQMAFNHLATDAVQHDCDVEIEHRKMHCRSEGQGCVWFDFAVLCDSPRSQADYIEISRLYHSVLLSHVPQMKADKEDAARRFIAMVDEFYERHVKLFISAAVPLEQLYAGERLTFEFERTLSRLQEMQSTEYLQRAHLA